MPRQGIVVTKPILPETVREDRVRLNVLNELGRVSRAVHNDFKRTVRTWFHDVTFTPGKVFTRGSRGNEAQFGFSVTTDDLIWGWLNEGTDVRYRKMIRGFEPKTEPGSFDSVAGWGWAVEFAVMPGIEARGWTEMAQAQYERPLFIAVTDAIMRGLSNQELPRRGG